MSSSDNRNARMTCERLLRAGSNHDVSLHVAVERGDPQLVSMILNYKPRLGYEYPNLNSGWPTTTSLSEADLNQDRTIVKLLLAAGDNPAIDCQKRSCFDYALSGRLPRVGKRISLEVPAFLELLTALGEHSSIKISECRGSICHGISDCGFNQRTGFLRFAYLLSLFVRSLLG